MCLLDPHPCPTPFLLSTPGPCFQTPLPSGRGRGVGKLGPASPLASEAVRGWGDDCVRAQLTRIRLPTRVPNRVPAKVPKRLGTPVGTRRRVPNACLMLASPVTSRTATGPSSRMGGTSPALRSRAGARCSDATTRRPTSASALTLAPDRDGPIADELRQCGTPVRLPGDAPCAGNRQLELRVAANAPRARFGAHRAVQRTVPGRSGRSPLVGRGRLEPREPGHRGDDAQHSVGALFINRSTDEFWRFAFRRPACVPEHRDASELRWESLGREAKTRQFLDLGDRGRERMLVNALRDAHLRPRHQVHGVGLRVGPGIVVGGNCVTVSVPVIVLSETCHPAEVDPAPENRRRVHPVVAELPVRPGSSVTPGTEAEFAFPAATIQCTRGPMSGPASRVPDRGVNMGKLASNR